MGKILEYNGYAGSMDISIEDNCLYGKILFIDDLVLYEADSPASLQQEFVSAVDDYIETCKQLGKDPQKPCKGSFNVRVTPELHRSAALNAVREDISLNELVAKSIASYINTKTPSKTLTKWSGLIHNTPNTDASISIEQTEQLSVSVWGGVPLNLLQSADNYPYRGAQSE